MILYKETESHCVTMPTKEFVKDLTPILRADQAFQASIFSRWDDDQKSNFMRSILLNMAPSKFIFADVDACLEHAIENEEPLDIEFFEAWKALGVRYLNLDSNNRTINLIDFFGNNIGIPEADYIVRNVVKKITKGKNDTYEKLPKVFREAFEEREITIEIYTKASREQLSQIFENINDGKPLNAPEKRNASTSKIAEVIRELAEEHNDFLTHEDAKWFSRDELIRRGIDNFIAGCAYIFFNDVETKCPSTSKNLSEMYQIGGNASKLAPSFRNHFNKFMNFITDDIYACPNKNSLLDLYVIWTELVQSNRLLKRDTTASEFITEYVKVIGTYLKDEKTTFDRIKYAKLQENITFKGMLGGRQFYNNSFRRDLILKKLDTEKYFVKVDSKRSLSRTERLVVATRDNLKTHEGKDIKLSKLQTGNYHAGHIEPHRDGEETTVDTNVIQTAEDNIKTGAKSLNIKKKNA